ncbi:restriction endonuclease [Halioglobus maricola]|uniref:Restriction endonuclease n=1 Tax=Halioglobus maricola TaxID=2601894 RepID=A0A5P9NIH7_9GAMM|nr:type II restriction endonuclease [Halioglobus maricola]QFU75345.1 restriction endonuclease [Halioglobus maricola]
MINDLSEWLRDICSEYEFQPYAVYRKTGIAHSEADNESIDWPLTANSEAELREKLRKSGQFQPLPKESAALANIVEVSISDYLTNKISEIDGISMNPGTERGYPDLELTGSLLADEYHAVDIKVARRSASGKQTQSRITLYTGNTYFKFPEVDWPSILRPFANYKSHIDLIVIYTLDEDSLTRVTELELVIQPSWRIASRERSSTTREYIGAVTNLEDLRAGRGAFDNEEEFYKFWRAYPFKIPKSVAKQLEKILAEK